MTGLRRVGFPGWGAGSQVSGRCSQLIQQSSNGNGKAFLQLLQNKTKIKWVWAKPPYSCLRRGKRSRCSHRTSSSLSHKAMKLMLDRTDEVLLCRDAPQKELLVRIRGCDIHNHILHTEEHESETQRVQRFCLTQVQVSTECASQTRLPSERRVCPDCHSGAAQRPAPRPSYPRWRCSGREPRNSTPSALENLIPTDTEHTSQNQRLIEQCLNQSGRFPLLPF